jgi:hypothetical protein
MSFPIKNSFSAAHFRSSKGLALISLQRFDRMSLATLVLIDEETANNLVSFVANTTGDDADKFKTKCLAMIDAKQGVELVAEILSKSDGIMSLENQSAIEGCFRAIISVILRFGEDKGSENITNMTNILTKDATDNNKLRLKLLLTVFNLVSLEKNKYFIILAILQYSIDSKQTNLINSFHSKILLWCQNDWKDAITSKQKQVLYLLVRKVLLNNTTSTENSSSSSASNANATNARLFFLNYMNLFDKNELLSTNIANDIVNINAIKDVIETPVNCYQERLNFFNILKKDMIKSYPTLVAFYEILDLLCNGDINSYHNYINNSNNKDTIIILNKYNIDVTQIETNMKLLSLCSLAAENYNDSSNDSSSSSCNSNILAYNKISEFIKCDEDDVELWVCDAIANGLLEASMDQFEKNLTITKCSYRSFDMNQWKDISMKLKSLRTDIATVYEKMQEQN